MNQSLEALENQYFLFRASLGALTAQGATPEQLDQLRTQIVRSRTNYWTAVNSVLHDDDPAVRALTSQLNTEQLTLDASIKHLGKVSEVLDAITKAVDIGSQIVSKAVSL